LLLSVQGYAGVACAIPDNIPEANCADLVIIRAATALDPHYACIFINSNAGRAHVNDVKVGIAQSHFNIGAAGPNMGAQRLAEFSDGLSIFS
jgi:type I restriction enzyme S subunit